MLLSSRGKSTTHKRRKRGNAVFESLKGTSCDVQELESHEKGCLIEVPGSRNKTSALHVDFSS